MLPDNDLPQVDIHLARLSGLDFFPTDAASLKELGMALMAADSVAIMDLVVTDWLAGSSARPTPADLRIAIHAENERNVPSPPVVEYAVWKALDRVAKKSPNPVMDEHLHLLKARHSELVHNHAAARWHMDAGGNAYREPTEISRMLAEKTKELTR